VDFAGYGTVREWSREALRCVRKDSTARDGVTDLSSSAFTFHETMSRTSRIYK
jgi:hypothetical protein